MRHTVLTIAAITLLTPVALAPVALAQAPAQQGPQNPAVKSMDQNNSSTPVAGANSFTQTQAMKQIQAKGFTHVTNLKKDKDGIWRAMAMKDGQSGPVSVDYQGNVN